MAVGRPPGLSHDSRGEVHVVISTAPNWRVVDGYAMPRLLQSWQEVAAHSMAKCCAWRGQKELVSLGHYPSPALVFQYYGGAKGWLLNLGFFSITGSFGLILCTAGRVSSYVCVCLCGSICSALSYAWPENSVCSGTAHLFHIVVSWKICERPVIFYGIVSCTKCPAGTWMWSR